MRTLTLDILREEIDSLDGKYRTVPNSEDTKSHEKALLKGFMKAIVENVYSKEEAREAARLLLSKIRFDRR